MFVYGCVLPVYATTIDFTVVFISQGTTIKEASHININLISQLNKVFFCYFKNKAWGGDKNFKTLFSHLTGYTCQYIFDWEVLNLDLNNGSR